MKSTESKPKEAIRLRTKAIKNGNLSLYLDIYFKGQRKYEFLRLYLKPEHTQKDSEDNRRTLQLANAIKCTRLKEMQEELHSTRIHPPKQETDLLKYIDHFILHRKKAYRNLSQGLKKHLVSYRGEHIPFRTVNKTFLIGFHQYLNTAKAHGNASKYRKRPLSNCTKWIYFNILSRILNLACHENHLPANPMRELAPNERPRRGEPRKTYLTIKEVRKLAATPLKHQNLKRAFLFSCLCGLRFSDVKHLQWSNLQSDSHGNLIAELIQQKTNSLLYLPISAEAAKQLPPKTTGEGLVFKSLPDTSYSSRLLKQWGQTAGITKKVTFHVARHTFATLGLTYGADIYTISKLLGHSNIRVTQIYADIINEKKHQAVNAIPPIE